MSKSIDIINEINAKHGTNFTERDFDNLNEAIRKVIEDNGIKTLPKQSDGIWKQIEKQAIKELSAMHERYGQFTNKVLGNEKNKEGVALYVFDSCVAKLKGQTISDPKTYFENQKTPE